MRILVAILFCITGAIVGFVCCLAIYTKAENFPLEKAFWIAFACLMGAALIESLECIKERIK